MKIKRLVLSPEWASAILFGLVAAGFFTYAVLRAARAPITFDEAATQLTYLSSGVFAVFDLRSANNHFLYTLLARLTGIFAGSGELGLRLPSLLGYLLYLGFSWAILKRFFGRFLALAGFLLLNLNPFVLEFFSLGRGYGLALGFEMAAMYSYLVFLDSNRRARDAGNRALAASLLLALVSALANLSFLNLLMGLWVFTILLFLIRNLIHRPDRSDSPGRISGEGRSRLLSAAVALSIPFNLIVIGQCLRLSEGLADPVSVSVHGPREAEFEDIQVSGIDFYDNEVPLTYQNGAWVPPKAALLKRLRLSFAGPVLDKIQGVDVKIGTRSLGFGYPGIKKWRHSVDGDLHHYLLEPSVAARKSLFRDMSGVINWKGDGVFFRAFALQAALLGVAVAFLLGLIYGLGRLAVGSRLLRAAELRPLRDSAGLAVLYLLYPIYSLNQNKALYFGGQDGFVKDTVYSLIGSSFYGARYAAGQERIVFLFMLGGVALALLWLGRRIQKKALAEHLEASSILAIMTIISLLVIAQRALFGIPQLLGRAAVFFIPLAGIFLLFWLRDLWRLRGAWRTAALVLLIGMTGISSYHFIRTANLTQTIEWSQDADTKAMIEDLTSLKARMFARQPRLRLGVDWYFWPSSVYYSKRKHLSWLNVYLLPTPWNCDVYYLRWDHPGIGSMTVLKRYPLTGNVLVR
jgi:hypothetical protein